MAIKPPQGFFGLFRGPYMGTCRTMEPVNPPMPTRKGGRPKSGKKTWKVRLSPKARKVAGKRGSKMGGDFSAYVEALIRRDNAKEFPESVILSEVSQ